MGINKFLAKTGGIDPELLDGQQLHALYIQGLEVQSCISELKKQLQLEGADKTRLTAALNQKKAKLAKIKDRFKHHLKQQPDYAKIRANAKRYVYLQHLDYLRLPIVPLIMDSVKYYMHGIFTPNVRTSKYFRMYANHLNYLHDDSVKEILLQHFSTLLDKQKEIFIDQLNKQSYIIQDKVLSTQTMQDLIELRTECSRLNQANLRYKAKEYQAKLIEKIKNVRETKNKSTEQLALLYLSKHTDILASITGSHNNDTSSMTLIQASKKTYQLHVEDQHYSQTAYYTLSVLDVMEYASAYLIEEQKIALKEMLFPPVNLRLPVNDLMYTRKVSSKIQ